MKITLEIDLNQNKIGDVEFEILSSVLHDSGFMIINKKEFENLVDKSHAKADIATKPVEDKTDKDATPTIPEKKKAAKKPVEKTVTVTLAQLKELAKVKVGATDRETVKAIISEFAPKLAEVKEADYQALSEKLA